MSDLRELLDAVPLPPLGGGKEARGSIVIVGGSASCPGAALLGGRAALRAGAGRVQLVVHPSVAVAVATAMPEALVLGWDPVRDAPPEAVQGRLRRAAAVVVGPGYETEEEARAAAQVASREAQGTVVLDARAILATTEVTSRAGCPTLVAPNPAEAARLLGRPEESVDDSDPGEVEHLAADVAVLVGGPAAVRGEVSAVSDGRQQWSVQPRVPGLGTPGSGDVFVGVLAAMLARGLPAPGALAWAIAGHAQAGRLLAGGSDGGFLAREIADAVPRALTALTR